MVQLLLGQSADIEAEDWQRNKALTAAAREGHEAVISLLLQQGADLEAKGQFSRTALMEAVVGGHEAVISLLLQQGADIEAKGQYGDTALIQAAWKDTRLLSHCCYNKVPILRPKGSLATRH